MIPVIKKEDKDIMNTIMIALVGNDPKWAANAIHQAYGLARKNQANLVLVNLVQTQYHQWLGTDFNLMMLDIPEVVTYLQTAEDYGVEISCKTYQYYALADAIVESAEWVKADVVFATLPHFMIPFWRNHQLHSIESQLTHQHRQLLTLEPSIPPSRPMLHNPS